MEKDYFKEIMEEILSKKDMETTSIIHLLAILAKSEGLYVEMPHKDETEKPDRSKLLKGAESKLTYSKFNKLEVGESSTTAVGTSSATSVGSIDIKAPYKKPLEKNHIPVIAALSAGIIGGVLGDVGAAAVGLSALAAAVGGSSTTAGGGNPAITGGGSSSIAGGGSSSIAVGGSSEAAGGGTGNLWSAVGGYAWNVASSLWRSVAGNYAVNARVQLVPVNDLVLNLGYAHRERLASKIRQIMNEHSVLNINALADEIQQDSSLVRRIILKHLIDFIVDDLSLNVVVSNKDDSNKS